MDPDALYEEIVRLCAAISVDGDDGELSADLVEAVLDLVTWLEKGGFPPTKFVGGPRHEV